MTFVIIKDTQQRWTLDNWTCGEYESYIYEQVIKTPMKMLLTLLMDCIMYYQLNVGVNKYI